MRTALLLASLVVASVSLVALAPSASASVPLCGGSVVSVCYDPNDLPCFIGVTFDVGVVNGGACVDWCHILGCPGPLLA